MVSDVAKTFHGCFALLRARNIFGFVGDRFAWLTAVWMHLGSLNNRLPNKLAKNGKVHMRTRRTHDVERPYILRLLVSMYFSREVPLTVSAIIMAFSR